MTTRPLDLRISPLFCLLALLLQLSILIFSPAAHAFSFPSFGKTEQPKFVRVNEAFPFNFIQKDHAIILDWNIRDGYYLYQHKISITSDHAQLGQIIMPTPVEHKDAYYGDVKIYTQPLALTIPIEEADPKATITVSYQGCAKAGLCYPPETRVIPLTPIMGQDLVTTSSLPNANATIAAQNQPVTITSAPATEQNKLASDLEKRWWTPFIFLALGIGLALTPCVLPMYPILTGIVLGGGKRSIGQAFKLAFVYVQGMALTYTLLGLVVASAGMQFQAALQTPAILIGLSILFVVLALSMFGLYSLQLPSSIQTRLANLSNRQKGGHIGGVFAMGAISGLVCSPCTTAPLSGALIYVAQSGNLVTGAVALYALAMGMGIPLVLVAVFGNQLLPKAGQWMNHIKTLFGFVLLAVPIFLLERILPANWVPYLWTVLGLGSFGWLYHVASTLQVSRRRSLIAISAIVGLVISSQPLFMLITGSQPTVNQTLPITVQFTQIHDQAQLTQALAMAKKENKPVLLDFYADWCVACKEFDEKTFHDPAVAPILKDFVLLQFDATKSNTQTMDFLSQHHVMGLPTIDFWDDQGHPLPLARLTGFMPPQAFLTHLQQNQLVRNQ